MKKIMGYDYGNNNAMYQKILEIEVFYSHLIIEFLNDYNYFAAQQSSRNNSFLKIPNKTSGILYSFSNYMPLNLTRKSKFIKRFKLG